MPNVMTNGEFFHIVSDAISGAEAHADLIALCLKAKALQKAVLAYLEKYEDRDLSEELLDMVTLDSHTNSVGITWSKSRMRLRIGITAHSSMSAVSTGR